MTEPPLCTSCGATGLVDLGTVGVRPTSVLSDTRLCPRPSRIHACGTCQHMQKVHAASDLHAIQELYAHYQAHHLSRGEEQPAFLPGRQPTARSRIALEACRDRLPERGRLLDFGCGNGAVLKSASRVLEGWELHGSDLNDRYARELLAIPGVAGFHHAGQVPPGGFDLVVLWHVLEHLADPLETLRRLETLLKPGGALLISVPDVERSVFDLAVMDHTSHFSWAALTRLFDRAGLETTVDGRDWIHNCLSGLFRLPGSGRAEIAPAEPAPGGRTCVDHLNRIVRRFETHASRGGYALFGTGMSSIWLLGQLSRLPAFLVDEDPAKTGQCFQGIPIRRPEDLRDATDILMPFSAATAHAIVARLRTRSTAWAACTFVCPEPLDRRSATPLGGTS